MDQLRHEQPPPATEPETETRPWRRWWLKLSLIAGLALIWLVVSARPALGLL